MPKAIFFDLDDTLLWDKKSIELALEYTSKDAERQFGISKDTLVQTVRTLAPAIYAEYPTHSFTKLIGINPFEGLWGEFGEPIHHQFRQMGEMMPDYRARVWTESLQELGIDHDEAGIELSSKFIEYRKKHPVLYEETFEVLNELKSQNTRMLLLTNGAPSLQLEKLKITPELVPYFEHILISGNFGIGKPSPIVFEHALRLMDLEASDVWMVGDNKKTDILGANRTGIESVWIQHDSEERPDVELDGEPTFTISRLKELLDLKNNHQ